MIFDERLTELRKELGVTQKDFAEKLQIEPSKYNKWENGKTVPDFDTVIKLANFFDVTVDYLVGNSNAQKAENEKMIEQLGLSEKAIQILESYQTYFKDHDKKVLIPIVNFLIENESFASELHEGKLFQKFDEVLFKDTTENDAMSAISESKLNILSNIESYFMIASEKDDYYENYIKSLGWDKRDRSYRQLLERIFLQNIEDAIRLARIGYLFDNNF